MYHSGRNPLRRITRTSEDVIIPKGLKILKIDGKLPGDKDYPLK